MCRSTHVPEPALGDNDRPSLSRPQARHRACQQRAARVLRVTVCALPVHRYALAGRLSAPARAPALVCAGSGAAGSVASHATATVVTVTGATRPPRVTGSGGGGGGGGTVEVVAPVGA